MVDSDTLALLLLGGGIHGRDLLTDFDWTLSHTTKHVGRGEVAG